MIKVAIATSSSEKINGIIKGFCRFFQVDESDVRINYSKQTESGVPEQPFDDETYIGAKNRVNNVKEKISDCDFFVSCEAGIESFANQYFNVQVICIFEKKSQKYFFGKSIGWQIPTEEIAVIKETTLDSYLRGKGIKAIEDLLGSKNSRSEQIAQATELALISSKL